MSYQLGEGVKVGEKILLNTGWKKVVMVNEKGVEVEGGGFLEYGSRISGWKK